MRHAFIPIDPDRQDPPVDMEATKERAALILRAPWRHPKLAAAALVLTTAVGVAGAWYVNPSYQAEAIIAVQKNLATPALGNPNQNQQQYTDFDPTLGVSELVKGRESVLSLIRQTHLLEKVEYPAGEPLTEDQKVQIAVRALERRLNVKSDGTTVEFSAKWNDPQTAYDIVAGAARNFLESRNAAEVGIISDGIAMLEEHATVQRDAIDEAMSDFLHRKEGWKTGGGTVSASTAPGPTAASALRPRTVAGPDPELGKRLEEKKQQIRETEGERRHQLAEAKAQMTGLLATFTPSHPTVIGLQRKIDALSDEPQNLSALKNEERTLLNELAQVSGVKAAAIGGAARGVGGGPVMSGPRAGMPVSAQDLEVADPASSMALSKLQARIHKYEEFMDQISAAKLELDLARNAFKHRYNMYRPPELPSRTKHPVRILLSVAGALAGLLLAFGLSAAVDVAGGRFIEPWQVKRRLSLPVLGEVSDPSNA